LQSGEGIEDSGGEGMFGDKAVVDIDDGNGWRTERYEVFANMGFCVEIS
jgi:hypothetical protein